MDATRIILDNTTTITHIDEGVLKSIVSKLAMLDTERKRYHILYECGTIQLTGIDHQLFCLVAFEGMGHVWATNEFIGKE